MSQAVEQLPEGVPSLMTVAEFLAWRPGDGRMWQLVDGVPAAMAPASRRHNIVLAELLRLVGNHLLEQGSPCVAVPVPGVVTPKHPDRNMRIADMAVTCSDLDDVTDPVLLVEVLSPSNQAETWINVWTYTLVPSVREIVVLHTATVRADVLRRDEDASWPDDPERVTDGDLVLDSIGFRTPLAGLYRLTRLRGHAGPA